MAHEAMPFQIPPMRRFSSVRFMLPISSETGGKLACPRDRLLHPLVVKREAPSSLRMIIRSIVEAARGLDNERF
jgi:hypothetical protein